MHTVSTGVDWVWSLHKRRKSTTEESLGKRAGAFHCEKQQYQNKSAIRYHFKEHIQHRKISHSAKSTKTLADDAPFALLLGIIRCQASTDSFTIADNIVCPEVLHVLGLPDCISLSGQSACGNSRAETSATLIQEQDLYPNTKVSAQLSFPEIDWKIPYLVAFVENCPNPAVILRSTTSKPRATLEINQPG